MTVWVYFDQNGLTVPNHWEECRQNWNIKNLSCETTKTVWTLSVTPFTLYDAAWDNLKLATNCDGFLWKNMSTFYLANHHCSAGDYCVFLPQQPLGIWEIQIKDIINLVVNKMLQVGVWVHLWSYHLQLPAKRARGSYNSLAENGHIFILSWLFGPLENLLAPWRDSAGQPSWTPTHYYCTQWKREEWVWTSSSFSWLH